MEQLTLSSKNTKRYVVFGGQDYSGNFHYVIFDRFWLYDIILRNGFMEIAYEEVGSNFIMKVKKI